MHSFNLNPAIQVKSTGSIEDLLPQVEEGNGHNNSADERNTSADEVETDVDHVDHVEKDAENDSIFHRKLEFIEDTEHTDKASKIIDDGIEPTARYPPRRRKNLVKFTLDHNIPARKWTETANICKLCDTVIACSAEVKDKNDIGIAASPYKLAPMNIRRVQKMKDCTIKNAWLTAYEKEIKVLISFGTFSIEPMLPSDTCMPTMETNGVKMKRDGILDKLKTHIVV